MYRMPTYTRLSENGEMLQGSSVPGVKEAYYKAKETYYKAKETY